MGRHPSGRVKASWFCGVLAVTLWTSPAALAAGRSDAGEPASSEGEIRFHARAVVFRHGPDGARAEFLIRVPYQQLKFVPKDTLYEAHVRLTVELSDRAGKRVGHQQREARVQITDASVGADSLLGEIYTLGIPAAPGRNRYRVLVEDLNVARQGLVYKMKNQKRQGKAEGEVDAGSWLFQDPALSGLELAWTIRARRESSAFGKGPYEVYPQPSGYFGLFQNEMAVYYEIYDSPPPPVGRSYRLHSVILAAAGDTVFASVDSLRVTEGSAWPHAIAVDVSLFPAGHYRIRLEVRRGDGPVAAASQAEFDILWAADSWLPNASDFYEVEAATLLSSEEGVAFRMLSMGEKEVRIEQAWREADPSPETAENEGRWEFRRRVAHANAHYTLYTPGMLSDRGRVYIRYGEPDDIKIERLPVAGKTLGYALGKSIPETSKETLTKTGSGVADSRPYEIWTYDLRGKELVRHYAMNEITSGMKFVFVDEQGYGEYTLRYSSTSGIH